MPKTTHIGVSGTYRNVRSVAVGVGGAWRNLIGKWVGVGGAWKEVISFFSIVNPMVFIGSTYFNNAVGEGFGSSASQTITVNTDGTWTVSWGGSFAVGENDSGNWGTPAMAGIGSNYWVRFTRTANTQSSNGSSTPSTAWQQLSSNRAVVVLASASVNHESASATYTIEIATDSGGSNIVTSATGVRCEVSATP